MKSLDLIVTENELKRWPEERVVIRAYGTPAPKGSPKLQTRDRRGRPLPFPRVLPDSPALERWAKAVGGAALVAVGNRPRPVFKNRPLAANVSFALPRPVSRKRARFAHYAVGDIDKLVRATLDPLHAIVFDNDTRIVALHVYKNYEMAPRVLLGESPDADEVVPLGAVIEVWSLDKE